MFTAMPVEHGGVVRLELHGDLDMGTVTEFNTVVDRLLDAGRHRLLIDLASLDFCDSAGLSAFVRGDNRAAAVGGWLQLTGATGRVERVLRISGLAEVLRHDQNQSDPGALQDR